MPNDLKALWQEQAVTVAAYSPDELRVRLVRQRRTLHLRNVIEYVAGVLVMAAFGFIAAVRDDVLVRAAAGLIVVGVVLALWQLHRRASAAPVPAEGDLMAFHRQQLTRQLAALRSVPLWYLGPLVPGMALFAYTRFRDLPPGEFWPAALGTAWIVANFGVIWLINHLAARKLARQLRDLDRIGDPQ